MPDEPVVDGLTFITALKKRAVSTVLFRGRSFIRKGYNMRYVRRSLVEECIGFGRNCRSN